MQTISLLNTKRTAQNLTRTIRDSMHLYNEYAPLQKHGAFHPAKGIAEKYPPHGRRTMANRAITLCYEKSNEDIASVPVA